MLKELKSNRSSASQPKYIVCCVTACTPLVDDKETFGFGVSLRTDNNKDKKGKQNFRTPAEFVCSQAFQHFSVRSTKNDHLRFFLPLWVSKEHWEMAKL